MIEARVRSLFVGNQALNQIEVDLEGVVGESHRGFTRESDIRDKPLPKKIPVQNWRQWSAVSFEELEVVAQKLGIPEISANLLDANIEFEGIEKFTQLPPGTKLWFPNDAILKVEADNEPCIYPGKKIAEVYPTVNPFHFGKTAWGLRGLVGVVYRAGEINVGDVVRVDIYKPRTYQTYFKSSIATVDV